MRVGKKTHVIDSQVMRKTRYSIDYAIKKIKDSPVCPHVAKLYLYGSCARHEQNHNSDVDLFLELKNNSNAHDLKDDIMLLKGSVTPPATEYPEVDMKVVIGNDWQNNDMLYYKNIRRDGIDIWNPVGGNPTK